jgi:agmatinase
LHSSKGDQFFISNHLTGKVFGLDEIPYLLFTFLAQARKVNEIYAHFDSVDQKSMGELLAYLISQELIYDVERPIDETFQVNNQTESFFNLPRYYPSQANSIVIAGLPFGKGNPISDQTLHAPGILRKFTSAFKLDLTQENNLETLPHILATETDLSPLCQKIKENSIKDIGDLFSYANEHADNYHKKVTRLSDQLFGAAQKPLFIGGDHSLTFPILKAANAHFENVVVIHLDAHTDTYEHPLDIAFRGKASNHHGNFAALSMELPNITSVLQFGVRGISSMGMTPVSPKQKIFHIKETKKIIRGELPVDLPADAHYYVTVDIDVLSPEFAPGTATPVPNGLSINETAGLLQRLLRGKKIIGWDFVEYNQTKDINEITCQVAIELIILFLNFLSANPHEN